jgi:DNA-directed RNA polymerase specialized sigma24 family protein
MPSPRTRRTYRPSLLNALDGEWRRISSDPDHEATVVGWAGRYPSMAGRTSLTELLETIRSGPLDVSEAVVWDLLDLARSDRLAVRVVLQAIVPGLGAKAQMLTGWSNRLGSDMVRTGEIDQLLLSAALAAIDHAIGQRRNRPLLSILWRTHRLVVREMRAEEHWRQRVRLETTTTRRVAAVDADDPDPHGGSALADLLASARRDGVLNDADTELLWLIGVEGYDYTDLQERLGVSYACIRQRRHRAETRLAQLRQAS